MPKYTVKVSLRFIYDDMQAKSADEAKEKAVSEAMRELDTMPLSDFYFDADATEERG